MEGVAAKVQVAGAARDSLPNNIIENQVKMKRSLESCKAAADQIYAMLMGPEPHAGEDLSKPDHKGMGLLYEIHSHSIDLNNEVDELLTGLNKIITVLGR